MKKLIVLLAFISMSFAISLSVNSCQNITAPGSYLMNMSITGAPNSPTSLTTFDKYNNIPVNPKSCIDIKSSNVTFDCGGNSITNSGVPYSIGIILESGYTNISVKNCQIFNYTHGVFIDRSSGNSFTNNVVNGNGDGFDLVRSNNDNFTNDTAINNLQYGFFLQSSNNNNFSTITSHSNNFRFWAFHSTIDVNQAPSTGNIVSNLNLGTSTVSFASTDVNIRDRPMIPTIASGSPSVEIDVLSTNQSSLMLDGETIVMGISDGNSSHSRAITSIGPTRSDYFNTSRAYAFDASGNPVEFVVPTNILSIPNQTAIPTTVDDGVGTSFAIGFNVSVFGRIVDTAKVDGDGFLYLNQGNPATTNERCCSGGEDMSRVDTQPNSNGPDILIAPDWDDLTLNPSQNQPTYNATYGIVGTAPNRIFVIYFKNVNQCCSGAGGNNFQVKLFENGTAATFGSTPLADPGSFKNIGKHVEATGNGNDTDFNVPSFLFLNVSYSVGDVSSVDPSSLFIAKNNGSWITNTATFANVFGVNTTTRNVYANITNFGSIFAPMGTASNATAPPSSGGGQSSSPLSIDLNSSCSGNVVTVSSSGPVSGAHVSVQNAYGGTIMVRNTDGSGQISFPGCGADVKIYASSSGYISAQTTVSLVSCGQCGSCTSNNDCSMDKQCQQGQCVTVPCSCGLAQGHQCVAYQCCSDSQCGSNQFCQDHMCKTKQTFECTSDAQCPNTQFCDIPPGAAGGSCKDVQGGACGNVTNHKFIPYGYECGTEPGCPSCQEGQQCMDHKCVSNDVTCPSTGTVGEQKSCSFTQGNQSCVNCDVQVTAPDGKTSSGKTDESGNFLLPLDLNGTYTVSLMKNGTLIKQVQIKSMPKAAPPPEQPKPATQGFDSLSLVLLIIIVIAIVAGIVYWFTRRK